MNTTSTLLGYFDKTFVINLPERVDRRREISDELVRIGSSKDSEKVVIFPAIKPIDLQGFPSLGARGCFLSHLAILREAKDQGYERVLILEDDLVFSKILLQQQDSIVAKLNSSKWDLVYLGHLIEWPNVVDVNFESWSQPLQQSHFVGFQGSAISTTVEFLDAVLSRPPGHPDGGPMHIDGAYSTYRQQNTSRLTLIAKPSLGFQRPSPSNIAGYRWFDQMRVLALMLSIARKIKTWIRR